MIIGNKMRKKFRNGSKVWVKVFFLQIDRNLQYYLQGVRLGVTNKFGKLIQIYKTN